MTRKIKVLIYFHTFMAFSFLYSANAIHANRCPSDRHQTSVADLIEALLWEASAPAAILPMAISGIHVACDK